MPWMSRGRDLTGVEVRMRIQPQHAQLFACLAAVTRDGGNGPHRQAVIAAQHDRQPSTRQLRRSGVHHGAVPRHDLIEVAIARHGPGPRIGRTLHVAGVDDVHTARGQRFALTRDAQCVGPIARAAMTHTDVGGCRSGDRRKARLMATSCENRCTVYAVGDDGPVASQHVRASSGGNWCAYPTLIARLIY